MIAHCMRNAGSPRCRGIVAATLPNAVTGLYACNMGLTTWAIFLIAAFLEVGGDAIIRMGLRGRGTILIVIGFAVLGSYGLIVNMVELDFSKIFGVYVCVFALVSVLFGRFVFREFIPATTWIGLGLILIGGFVIQLGNHR
jgi:drug/metabolite transporter superfamily protein YnfA